MFANLVMFGVLALVCSLVQTEVYSFLHAVAYARKQIGTTLAQKVGLTGARYQWASVVFHESFRQDIGQAPAYRVSYALYVWAAVFAAFVAGELGFGVVMSGAVTMSVSLGVAVGFFCGAYGKAFFVSRADVTKQIEQGTWVPA